MCCVYLVMMVSTDAIGCGGFGGVRVRVRVASRPSQKPGLSSRPGKNNFLHAPTITQPPQWKQMLGNARRHTMDGPPEAKARPPRSRRQAQVEYFQLAGCASRQTCARRQSSWYSEYQARGQWWSNLMISFNKLPNKKRNCKKKYQTKQNRNCTTKV